MFMKLINDEIIKEYKNWLISPNNPDYTGTQKYSQYDYYFKRLIEKAIELELINESEIIITDINWLNKFHKIYESSSSLQHIDKTTIGHLGGIASLKKFIAFINYKNSLTNSIEVISKKELFRKYLADCGRINEREGNGPSSASLDEYWRALSREQRINIFELEDDLKFEEIKNKSGLYNEGDLKQGAKWYSKFLSETKFKRLLEWFVNQIRINNEIVPGKKTSGKGYNGGNIRNLYGRYRSFGGFDLDCTVQGGYMRNIPGSNYIHLTGSWLNINPIFNSNSNVAALKINYKPNNKVEREYPSKTIEELGLYDNNFPNEALRRFFEDYKKEIDVIQRGIKTTSPREIIGNNTMELNKELNLILYGPPGTGKTYNTIICAVQIIEGDKFTDNGYDNIKVRYDKYFNEGRIAFTTFHQSYGYEEFIEGIKPETHNGAVSYAVKEGVFKEFCSNARDELVERNGEDDTKINKYVFIIDEINRGNVSKIFGELITLIEPTKRLGAEEEMTCKLPYSTKPFGVPKNVYILGTMNTADRSLVQLDAALRRRFAFKEMMPDYGVIRNNVGNVENIDIAKLLETINNRITVLLDREHQIGHSYFLKLKENNSVKKLAEIFRKNIIPLLQEYFFDDYTLIEKVLSSKFIDKSKVVKIDGEERVIYDIKVTEDPQDYIDLCNGKVAENIAEND